ncbi:MAG TPA: hypothetical protein VIT65_08535 [Microlunatus sp.]
MIIVAAWVVSGIAALLAAAAITRRLASATPEPTRECNMVFTPGLAILVVTAALSYALAQQGLTAPV